jgi:hypothetical protein
MAKPAQGLGDRFDRLPCWNKRPANHHDRQAKITRRFDLRRGSGTSRIPGNDNVRAEILKQGPITRAVERTTRHDHFCVGQRQWIARRIDQTNQVGVLRIRRESLQMLPADPEEYTACLESKSLRRCRDIIDLDPSVARQALPGGTFQRQQGHSRDVTSCDRIRAHLRREWMGGIDDPIDTLRTKVVREASNAAKAADAPGNRRQQRIPGTARIGQYRIDTRIIDEGSRQPVRVGGAAEEQNAQSSRWRGRHDREQ